MKFQKKEKNKFYVLNTFFFPLIMLIIDPYHDSTNEALPSPNMSRYVPYHRDDIQVETRSSLPITA